VTETRARRRRSPVRVVEQVLLAIALLSLVAAVVIGFIPVTNPSVQSCGSPFVYSWRSTNDVVLAPPGSPSAPADEAQLLAQAPCHERVDRRLLLSGLAVVVTVIAGLAGAVLGLADDRSVYRASPRFEAYLRERPGDAPSDPWNQPVVPVDDLGRRLPDLEWREIRVVLGLGVLAIVVLAWLGPWSQVRDALRHLQAGWLLAVLAFVAATYPIAAHIIVIATEGAGHAAQDRHRYTTQLGVSIASSFTGRLLPEYGAAGLAVHRLVREGDDRPTAIDRIGALTIVALVVHGVVLVVIGLIALGAERPAAEALRWSWAPWLVLVALVLVGLVDAPRRWATLVVRPDTRAFEQLGQLASDPLRASIVGLSTIVRCVIDAFVLLAAARAVGATAPTTPILLVGLLLPVVVVIAPTPDGAGLVELAAVLGLVWAGVGAGTAVVAMVVARLISFWLPMLPGWFALRRLERSGAL
jgi:undecaprenyl-diphosphatase